MSWCSRPCYVDDVHRVSARGLDRVRDARTHHLLPNSIIDGREYRFLFVGVAFEEAPRMAELVLAARNHRLIVAGVVQEVKLVRQHLRQQSKDVRVSEACMDRSQNASCCVVCFYGVKHHQQTRKIAERSFAHPFPFVTSSCKQLNCKAVPQDIMHVHCKTQVRQMLLQIPLPKSQTLLHWQR